MNEQAWATFHKGVSRYSQLEPEAWSALVALASPMHLPKESFFVREGEVCTKVAFVMQGLLRYYYVKDAEEMTGHVAEEGEFITAYPSFLSQSPSRQVVDALEDSTVLVLKRDDINGLYDRFHSIERLGRRLAEEILIGSQSRTALFILDTAEQRYDWLVSHRPGLIDRIPQYLLASYIGIKPESLSRIRSRRIRN